MNIYKIVASRQILATQVKERTFADLAKTTLGFKIAIFGR